jgi:hypothetical protein
MVLEVYKAGVLEAVQDCLGSSLLRLGLTREEMGEVDELVLSVHDSPTQSVAVCNPQE